MRRPRPVWPWLLGVAVVVLLCVGLVAVASALGGTGHRTSPGLTPATSTAVGTPPATRPPAADTTAGAGRTVFKLGDTADGTLDDGTTFTIRVSNAAVRGPDISVTVDMACTRGSVPYNPLYFTLKGPDGTEYDTDFGGTLHSGDLNAGQKVHGTVRFTAPSSVLHGGEVELSNALLTTVAYWTLS